MPMHELVDGKRNEEAINKVLKSILDHFNALLGRPLISACQNLSCELGSVLYGYWILI